MGGHLRRVGIRGQELPPGARPLTFAPKTRCSLADGSSELAYLRCHKIGYIFQTFNLIPVLDVRENIEFPCLLRKEDRGLLKQRVELLAEEVGLTKVLHERLPGISETARVFSGVDVTRFAQNGDLHTL